MLQILTDDRMKACDAFTIEQIGVPSAVLMERAALAVSMEVQSFLKTECSGLLRGSSPRILVVCGSGNNGGDGYACARILKLWGMDAVVLEAGNPEHMTEETRRQRRICMNVGVEFANPDQVGFSDFHLIVDALFGIGLSKNVTGKYEALIQEINESKVPVISVDIPSGISAGTGAVCGTAVKAAVTVTMQCRKPGHLFYPGAFYTGKLVCADIGVIVPEEGWDGRMLAFEKNDLKDFIPGRDPSGNKGTFGKVLLVAGSFGMSGAAYLAAKAALRTGAGMVKILTDEANRVILQQLLPEALLSVYRSTEDAVHVLREALSWCDVCAAGPGLSVSETSYRLVRELLMGDGRIPLVLDADAINVLKGDTAILKQFRGTAFITPHIVEMARLTGESREMIGKDPLRAAVQFTRDTGVSCILKDARTVTACTDGRVFINLSGNDGMAAAGSGDVLTGILAALIGRGAGMETAGALASYVHGLAGDAAAERLGRSFMTASDIIDGLRCVL